MTDLEDFMMLFGPEFKAYLQHKSIDNLLQKELDNKQNPVAGKMVLQSWQNGFA